MECQGGWIEAYAAKIRHLHSWWQEFRSLFKEDTRGIADSLVWELTKKQAIAFRLPAVQAEVSGWWETPCSICDMSQRDFLPHSDFCGMRDLRETQQEETLALALALQHCVERSRMLCNVAWGLQRCMAPLIHLKEDDILDALLLRAADDEPGMSPTPVEEAALLGNAPTPQRAQAITAHPSDHPEETPKPKGVAKLECTMADPQGMWRQPLLLPLEFTAELEWTTAAPHGTQRQALPLPPGFELPVSGPPPLESGEPQVRSPEEAWLDLTSLASMQMVVVRNESTGKFECQYETQVVGSLCLSWPDTLALP